MLKNAKNADFWRFSILPMSKKRWIRVCFWDTFLSISRLSFSRFRRVTLQNLSNKILKLFYLMALCQKCQKCQFLAFFDLPMRRKKWIRVFLDVFFGNFLGFHWANSCMSHNKICTIKFFNFFFWWPGAQKCQKHRFLAFLEFANEEQKVDKGE